MTSFSSAAFRRANFILGRGILVLAITLSASCDRLRAAMTAHTDVVARAAGKEFQVTDAVRLISNNEQVPADSMVIRALADMWIEYTLLATAVSEDSTLAALDLTAFTEDARQNSLINQLRAQVIQADTVFDAEEIEQRWTTEGPSAEVRARHILLRTAADATQAQRDSVRQQAEALRVRATAGESFADLATQYSQDPGSAVRGGDLDFFGRGQMVAPFEEAAFALEAGQISGVVETPFGYHVIKVEERRQQALGADREQFRQQLVGQAIQAAEMSYIDTLTSRANVEIQKGGLEVVKEIATRPDTRLRGRAARREIATYEGGEYTAEEFGTFIRSRDAQTQAAFATAPLEQLEGAVKQLVQMELLLAEAEKLGLTVPPEEETALLQQVQLSIRQLVEQTGFAEAARSGATEAELQNHVLAIMEGIVNGTAPFGPLGPLGVALKEAYDYEVNDGAFGDVITQVLALRAQQTSQQVPQAPEGMTIDSMGMPVMPQTVPQGPPPGQ